MNTNTQLPMFTRTVVEKYITTCHTVVWEKFTVEYFHVKIVCVKIFLSSRVADEKFLTVN